MEMLIAGESWALLLGKRQWVHRPDDGPVGLRLVILPWLQSPAHTSAATPSLHSPDAGKWALLHNGKWFCRASPRGTFLLFASLFSSLAFKWNFSSSWVSHQLKCSFKSSNDSLFSDIRATVHSHNLVYSTNKYRVLGLVWSVSLMVMVCLFAPLVIIIIIIHLVVDGESV